MGEAFYDFKGRKRGEMKHDNLFEENDLILPSDFKRVLLTEMFCDGFGHLYAKNDSFDLSVSEISIPIKDVPFEDIRTTFGGLFRKNAVGKRYSDENGSLDISINTLPDASFGLLGEALKLGLFRSVDSEKTYSSKRIFHALSLKELSILSEDPELCENKTFKLLIYNSICRELTRIHIFLEFAILKSNNLFQNDLVLEESKNATLSKLFLFFCCYKANVSPQLLKYIGLNNDTRLSRRAQGYLLSFFSELIRASQMLAESDLGGTIANSFKTLVPDIDSSVNYLDNLGHSLLHLGNNSNVTETLSFSHLQPAIRKDLSESFSEALKYGRDFFEEFRDSSGTSLAKDLEIELKAKSG